MVFFGRKRGASLLLLLLPACSSLSLQASPPRHVSESLVARRADAVAMTALSRRDLLSSTAASCVLLLPKATSASGGATAGKTTSIPRAKTRYYGRINAVIDAFKSMGTALDAAADSKAVKAAGKAFFADDPNCGASELKSAGYLLSVAFKIDSKIPPDKIQQVKDWKAVQANVETLQKSMSAGKAAEARGAFDKTRASVEVWLAGVDLDYNAMDCPAAYCRSS